MLAAMAARLAANPWMTRLRRRLRALARAIWPAHDRGGGFYTRVFTSTVRGEKHFVPAGLFA